MRDLLARQVADHLETARAVEALLPSVEDVGRQLCQAFESGNRAYTFGNGGSAADAQHLVAELIGRYRRERRPLPAVALTVDPSVVTCIGNDYTFDEVFARQVTALAGPGDVVVGFTTSGRSVNVVKGLEAARTAGATTVLFAAGDGGEAVQYADLALLATSMTTARTQEMHLFLLHLVSEWVDAWAAGEVDEDGNYLAADVG
ncbi:SIS domain-containing protein [Actinopolymorpha sp. B17G11]|uniref:D-sedoheptulose-7-phosphate isomerase n=1 Tax=unclassified Actinopolymorpha TaxID=2627063 RepID=UPI0032D8CB09